jgi:osmotically-inducible protein OsmY
MEIQMYKKYSILLPLLLSGCAAPLVGGLGSVGMHAAEDRGLGGTFSDEALQFTIRSKLCGEIPNCHVIDMTVYKSRVLMTGVVESPQVKTDAVRVAKSVEGVKEVIDGLNIEGQDTFAEYVRDSWITTKLKSAIYSEENVYAPNYTITTFDRVVYVFGTAGSQEEMQIVMNDASDITGVKRVVNLIEIKPNIPE